MKYDEFIARVAENVGVPESEAGSLVRATLATLAERISGGEAQDLAAQLPPPLDSALVSARENAEAFDFEEFVQRTAERAGAGGDTAARAVVAVFATVGEAVSPGEFDDVLAQLPAGFHRLGTSQPR
jgi:uncharacterized protein (DUF2267 family)